MLPPGLCILSLSDSPSRRCRLQETLGTELASLIEDPQNASVRVIAAEAYASLASGRAGPQAATETAGSLWISPAPATVKMRLFCLPYAGGVSENVYARYATCVVQLLWHRTSFINIVHQRFCCMRRAIIVQLQVSDATTHVQILES